MNFKEVVVCRGEASFRSRVVLATLSGKTLRMENFRTEETKLEDDEGEGDGVGVGLRDYEVAFLRLMQAVTNGSVLEINDTGTGFIYEPGIIYGGKVDFTCPPSRGIGYFLEMLLALAPFSKLPFDVTLQGITHNARDASVDALRLLGGHALRQLGLGGEGLQLQVTCRGAAPLGGGRVRFQCPILKTVTPFRLVEPGRIKRIRGVASCARMSPQTATRLVQVARASLTRFIPDIVIHADVARGVEAGPSPGFSLTLVAESSSGVLLAAEACGGAGGTPEQLGRTVVAALLSRISEGGAVDASLQWLYLLWAALATPDVSVVCLSPPTAFTIQFLRELRAFFKVVVQLQPLSSSSSSSSSSSTTADAKERRPACGVLATCLGIGYMNYSQRSS